MSEFTTQSNEQNKYVQVPSTERTLEMDSMPDYKWMPIEKIHIVADGVNQSPIQVNDPVNHPAHYTDGKIEVIDFIEDKKLGFCLGNAIKYISRAGKKNKDKTVEDLKKAVWYIERYIKSLEE